MLDLIIRLSIAGSATSLVLFLCTRFWKGMPKRWAYYLWLLALVRFLLPVGFPTLGTSGPVAAQQVGLHVPAPVVTPDAIPNTAGAGGQLNPVPAVPADSAAVSLSAVLTWLWLAGMGLSLAIRLGLYLRFCLQLRRARRPRARIGRMVVYSTPAVHTPLLLGFFRPAIYLPSSLPVSAVKLALQHELVHARRGDLYYKWFVQLVAAVHWFNPLVYLAAREIARLCERSCDEAVVQNLPLVDRKAYASLLLHFAEMRRVPATELAGGGRRQLEERIAGVLRGAGRSRKAVALVLCATVVLLLLAACSGAAVKQIPVSPAEEPGLEDETPSGGAEHNAPPSGEADAEASADTAAARAAAAFDAERYGEAIDEAEAALAQDGADVSLWLISCNSHYLLGDVSGAAVTARDGYAATGDGELLALWAEWSSVETGGNAAWSQALAAFRRAQTDGTFEQAAASAETALAQASSPALWALYGESLYQAGQLAEAADAFWDGFHDSGAATLGTRAILLYEQLEREAPRGDEAARIQTLETELATIGVASTVEPYTVMLLAEAEIPVSLGLSQMSCLPGAMAYPITVGAANGMLFCYESVEGARESAGRVSPDGRATYGDGTDNVTVLADGATPVYWFQCEDELLFLPCTNDVLAQAVIDALGEPFAGSG